MSPWARMAGLAILAMIAGCAALQKPPPVRGYRLAYPPPERAEGEPLPVVVRVMPFGIAAAYDREPFVYRTGPYDIGEDYYHRWLASPALMITDLIARDLAAAGTVQAILQSPSPLPADYELGGHIETMEERDDDGCRAHLRIRMLLLRAGRRARTALVQQSLVADEPCTRGDAASYVAAMSRATAQLSDTMRAALAAAIAADRAREDPPRDR